MRSGWLAVGFVAALVLTGCASDPLAEDYLNGGNENYISGSGIVEVPADERGDPVSFEAQTDAGTTVTRSDYDGQVLVVNFWYAGCVPCRTEAPELGELSTAYDGAGASFLGVNIYDNAEQSLAFAVKWGIPYPSVLDDKTGTTRLAFAGVVSPNAVPTTFVLDQEGRIAARISGPVPAKSILDTLISELVAAGG